MTIDEHLTTFAGLPVVAYDAAPPPGPAAVAWRVADDAVDAGADEFAAIMAQVLRRSGPDGPVALVFGQWGEAYSQRFPLDLLLDHAGALGRLQALFLGEMTSEECEISWIQHGDPAPLLDALPGLRSLWIRGGESMDLSPVRHTGLRELVIQSGGLPARVVRSIGASELPHLEHLELWLGTPDYGGDTAPGDLAGILDGRSLPALTRLGLRNSWIADEVAAAVAAAPVVDRLTRLDLSLGTLGDAGGEALLAGRPLTHLRELDLHHHYLSEEVARRLAAELPGVAVDLSGPQDPARNRYPEVSE